MLSPIAQAAYFLIQTLFNLYILFVLLRIIFHWVHINPKNQFLLTIARMTNPPLRPLYKVVPIINGLDLGAVILLLSLSTLKIGVLFWLQTSLIPPLAGLLTLAFAEILNQFINIFLYAVVLLTFMSWLNPLSLGPIIEITVKILEPLLRPARWLTPKISEIDFSPMVIFLGLRLIDILIVNPLTQIGINLIKNM